MQFTLVAFFQGSPDNFILQYLGFHLQVICHYVTLESPFEEFFDSDDSEGDDDYASK